MIKKIFILILIINGYLSIYSETPNDLDGTITIRKDVDTITYEYDEKNNIKYKIVTTDIYLSRTADEKFRKQVQHIKKYDVNGNIIYEYLPDAYGAGGFDKNIYYYDKNKNLIQEDHGQYGGGGPSNHHIYEYIYDDNFLHYIVYRRAWANSITNIGKVTIYDKNNKNIVTTIRNDLEYEPGTLKINFSKSKNVICSSYIDWKNMYSPIKAIDGDFTTCWLENVKGPGIGEFIQIDFNNEIAITDIEIAPGYFDPKWYKKNNRIKSLEVIIDNDIENKLIIEFQDKMETKKIQLSKKYIKVKTISFVIKEVYRSGIDNDTGISEIIFWIHDDKLNLENNIIFTGIYSIVYYNKEHFYN